MCWAEFHPAPFARTGEVADEGEALGQACGRSVLRLGRVVEQHQRRIALIESLRQPPGDAGVHPLGHPGNQRAALRLLDQPGLAHRASGGEAGGKVDPAQQPLVIDMAWQASQRHRFGQRRD